MDNLPVKEIESQKKVKRDESSVQSSTLMKDIGNPDLTTPKEYNSEATSKLIKVG